MDLGARRFEIVLDLSQLESVGVALGPIGCAIEGVEGETMPARGLPPIRSFADGHAPHQPPLPWLDQPCDENERPVLPKPPYATLRTAEDATRALEDAPPEDVVIRPPQLVQ